MLHYVHFSGTVLHSLSSSSVLVLTTCALALNYLTSVAALALPSVSHAMVALHAPQVIATGGSAEKLKEVCKKSEKTLNMYPFVTWSRVFGLSIWSHTRVQHSTRLRGSPLA
jgi:hypothetical protein